MKGFMMCIAPLCLLLCWMLPVNSMMIRFNLSIQDASQALSMVDDSVDDMYFGCNERMKQTVQRKYFPKENDMQPFKAAWEEAEKCATNKQNQHKDRGLTKDHIKAICVYTSDYVYRPLNSQPIYELLNEAVRTQGKNYGSTFQFHTLHFLLTSAIQILNNNHHCQTTYRRTDTNFTGEVNQIIRFGAFTSTSKRTDLKGFGNETCFKIKTCSGAYLENYAHPDFIHEEEVLIPPYEKFIITEEIRGEVKIQGLEDCEKVFVMKSMGCLTTLNCKIASS